MKLSHPQRTLILGPSQSGKTTLLAQILRNETRRICAVVTQPDHLTEIGPILPAKELATADTWPHRFRLVIHPEHLDGIARVIYACRDLLFVIDDLDAYLKRGARPYWLYWITRCGRHRGIGWLYVSGRPKAIGPDLREHWRDVMIFAFRDRHSLTWIEEEIGIPAEQVRGLDRFQFARVCADTHAPTQEEAPCSCPTP